MKDNKALKYLTLITGVLTLWYCYEVISTAGFGDVVAVTFIGKMCSVLLTIYSLFVVAIATGVVVNFYTQMFSPWPLTARPGIWEAILILVLLIP